MRAMTISGMCIQWDTDEEYLYHFEKNLDLDKPEKVAKTHLNIKYSENIHYWNIINE